jgi:hypothetical protein
MTDGEFDELADLAEESDQAKRRLAALCRSVGMPEPPDLWAQLRGRYGAASEDFAPYKDGCRLVDVAQTALSAVNARRREEHRVPLYLRWYSRAELSRDRVVRDCWRRGHSVLVVDSVSALHHVVAKDLLNLPQPREATKAAVACLPPYTRHTGALEVMIEASLDHHALLSDAFRDWRDTYDLPSLAFDIPSETSLRRWFCQLLFALDVAQTPVSEKVRAMTGHRPAPALKVFSRVGA